MTVNSANERFLLKEIKSVRKQATELLNSIKQENKRNGKFRNHSTLNLSLSNLPKSEDTYDK